MQRLSGPELASQRAQFVACMNSAGISVSPTTSYRKIASIFSNPASYKSLSAAQLKQSDDCTSRFQEFLFSITTS
jgi:hypothetical protein